LLKINQLKIDLIWKTNTTITFIQLLIYIYIYIYIYNEKKKKKENFYRNVVASEAENRKKNRKVY
jgi:hypothetical protein